MSTPRWLLPVLVMILVAGIVAPAHATPPDATLFTTYSMFNNSINWVVCGSTQQSSGCYSAGNLGPFGKIGAIIEGIPKAKGKTSTVTRYIYVIDVAAGNNHNQVLLYVYKKTDVVSSSFDTVTVTLSDTVTLPLVGGTSALASMAANKGFLFAGTNLSTSAVRIQKSNLSMTTIPGFSPPIPVTAVTADGYGYVTVTFGSFSGGSTGFAVYGPDGNNQEDGGGASFMLSTDQAVLPSSLP